jgi:hypothetical protein
MLHFTCDLCGRELQPGDDRRYVVKIEAFVAGDPAELTEADLEDDHLQAISEVLRESENEIAPEQDRKHFRFDLCDECHRKFVRDPIGKDAIQKFDFSKN